jgi:hypothetical protein
MKGERIANNASPNNPKYSPGLVPDHSFCASQYPSPIESGLAVDRDKAIVSLRFRAVDPSPATRKQMDRDSSSIALACSHASRVGWSSLKPRGTPATVRIAGPRKWTDVYNANKATQTPQHKVPPACQILRSLPVNDMNYSQ